MAEYWSNNDRGYRIRLWLDQVSQNVAGNSSQVRVRLALLSANTSFSSYSCSAYVDINGQRLNWAGSPSVGYNATIWLIDQTITVGHNADGKKSFNFAARFTGSGGWSPGTLSLGTGTFTLTTIPRTSSLSVGNCVIGSNVTITINRQNDSFTHTVRYWWGDKKGTIATNVGTSCLWTIPNDFANDIPNSTSGTGTLYVDTYSGGTLTGTQQIAFTATVPASIKPSFSGLTLNDTNGVVKGLLSGNNFVQILSNVQVWFQNASGSYGSSITGYKAELVNKNQVTNSNGGTLGIMNFNGSATIRASVFDSRGRQSDTRDITINVIEYFAPVLSFSATRTRENQNIIQVVRNAKIAPITVSGSQKNVMSLTFKVAPLGSNSFSVDNGSAAGTYTSVSSLNNSAANLAGNYAANKSFTVIGTLSDKFTSTEFSATIATESVVLSYDKDGRLGVGKVIERGVAGSIDAAGDIYARNKPIQQHQLTNNDGRSHYNASKAVDLNTKTKNEFFSCNEPKNSPLGDYNGQFYVAVYSESDNYLSQNAILKDDGRMFTRTRLGGNWSAWVEYALASHVNLVNTGWQSAGFAGTYYKRVGDVLTVRYECTGTGSNLTIGSIPNWSAPQSYMFVIAGWSIGGSDNSHLQINANTSALTILSSGKGVVYRGQITIMI
ncbi:DUF859 domain-containing protein [Streptococcus hyointestinalis]|nr:DUF859 domain-containing protein [Streptococcus hyointestinalis]